MKELGPGISTYHQLLVWLFFLLLLLFLLHIPILLTFHSYGFYENEPGAWVTTWTLGNMGFSKTECVTGSMSSGNT
jgi:hypothetical protein